jgi:hypothetical protein
LFLDIFHLSVLPGRVHPECRRATGERNFIETGFHHVEQYTAVAFLEFEDDQRRWLL